MSQNFLQLNSNKTEIAVIGSQHIAKQILPSAGSQLEHIKPVWLAFGLIVIEALSSTQHYLCSLLFIVLSSYFQNMTYFISQRQQRPFYTLSSPHLWGLFDGLLQQPLHLLHPKICHSALDDTELNCQAFNKIEQTTLFLVEPPCIVSQCFRIKFKSSCWL